MELDKPKKKQNENETTTEKLEMLLVSLIMYKPRNIYTYACMETNHIILYAYNSII